MHAPNVTKSPFDYPGELPTLTITDMVMSVCPVYNIVWHNKEDPESWELQFLPDTTEEQREKARYIVRNWKQLVEALEAKAAPMKSGVIDV